MATKTDSLLVLCKLFRVDYDSIVIAAMIRNLEDMTDDEIAKACDRAIRDSKFMPSISDIRDLVMDDRAQHPPPRKRSPPITKDKLWARLVKQDKQEMGDMTDEEYEKHKADYLAETGEVWWPPGWNPKEEWNEDGTQKGLDELYNANKTI